MQGRPLETLNTKTVDIVDVHIKDIHQIDETSDNANKKIHDVLWEMGFMSEENQKIGHE